MRSHRLLALGTALLLVIGSRVAGAQSLSVTPASVGTLTVSTALAGQEPAGVAMSGGTYTVGLKKNKGISTITAQLTAPLPAGTTLSITLAAPAGATSAGPVQLSTSPQPVVINLPNASTSYFNLAIDYTFTATSAAGVVTTQSASVTLSLAP